MVRKVLKIQVLWMFQKKICFLDSFQTQGSFFFLFVKVNYLWKEIPKKIPGKTDELCVVHSV